MNDICFYSGLPYTCDFCPEDEAPCNYMKTKKETNKIYDSFFNKNPTNFVLVLDFENNKGEIKDE